MYLLLLAAASSEASEEEKIHNSPVNVKSEKSVLGPQKAG